MTEWITQEDWSTVKVGDQVLVTCEGGAFAGTVVGKFIKSLTIRVFGTSEPIDVFSRDWSLSVPAKPAVVLPTERGIYLDRYAMLWTHEMLNGGLVFRHAGKSWKRSEAARYGPFTKLEPVAVTAKKVLDRLRYRLPAFEWFGSLADDICDEFGVTDE